MRDNETLDPEKALVQIVRTCGYNRNPIGYFRESLASRGFKVNLRELSKLGLIKVTDARGSIGYFSAWMQVSTKGKNLYNKVNINYRYE
jgi:hypothetical protein